MDIARIMPVHNYIVRIYRHDMRNPRKIVGIVEEVENETKQAFEDFDELKAILCSPRKDVIVKRKKATKPPRQPRKETP